MKASDLADRLHARKTTSGWSSRCPAHEDRNASLSISEGHDGRVLVKCFAGCSFEAIVQSLGLKPADLMPPREEHRPTVRTFASAQDAATACTPHGATLEAVYPYPRAGQDFAAVARYRTPDNKTFRQFKATASGWAAGGPDGKWPLYHEDDLSRDGIVYWSEGEKAADAGRAIGLLSVSTAGGSAAPSKSDFSAVKDRDLAVLPDNDTAGQKYGSTVATLAHAAGARSIRIINLPGLPPKGDLFDWLAAGGTREALQALVDAAPMWQASSIETAAESPTMAPTAEAIRSGLWEISTAPKMSPTERNRAIAATVVQWLHVRGRFYHHAERRDFASVMYFDGTRKLLLPVQGDSFVAWLADMLSLNRSEHTFKYIVAAVETEGLSERSTGIIPASYWSATPSAFYMSNGPGSMVRMSAAGVELVDNGVDQILFPCGATLPAWKLTNPVDPFEACSLFRGASATAAHGGELLKLWATSLPSDQKTKPPLSLSGTVGSGKTRTVRGIFELYGLPQRVSAVNQHGEGDFWTALDGGGLACFDNCDTRIPWLPDALAAAATAGTQEKRKLYSDSDRVCLRARAWVAITSANPSFASDAGLADRLLVVRLGRREGGTSESALSEEIAAARDAGLSWICQTLSATWKDTTATPSGLNQRHPDFATLAVKIGRAIGREIQAVAALRAAEADKGLFNLENDAIGAAILELLTSGPFNGTAAELLTALIVADPTLEGGLSAKRLAKRIAKLWPHLQSTLKARQEKGHGGHNRYSFQPPAGAFGAFETAFSEKSLVKNEADTFPKTSLERHQTHQPTRPDPFIYPADHDNQDEIFA